MRSSIKDAPRWVRIQFYRHVQPSYPWWAVVLYPSLNSSARSSSYRTTPYQYQYTIDTFMKILDRSFLSTNQSLCQMFPMGKIVCLSRLLVWMISRSHMPTLMAVSFLLLSGDTQQPWGPWAQTTDPALTKGLRKHRLFLPYSFSPSQDSPSASTHGRISTLLSSKYNPIPSPQVWLHGYR